MVTNSEAVFACHSKACAPPPAGSGGSSPSGRVSGARVGQSYHDRDHGPVTVSGVRDRPGKPYDEVEITKADGSKAKVFPGKAGLAGRSRPATTARPAPARAPYRSRRDDGVNDDDGYDAAKDAFLTGDGPRPYPSFGRRWLP